MSARDDADMRASAPQPPGTRRGAWMGVVAGACLGFLASALLVQHLPPGPWPRYETRVTWTGGPPAAAEWPRPARPGEAAFCEGDGDRALLVVRSPRAEDARELAVALQR